jgi:hypothetical protein
MAMVLNLIRLGNVMGGARQALSIANVGDVLLRDEAYRELNEQVSRMQQSSTSTRTRSPWMTPIGPAMYW